ncbi:MFS transporter [Dactylosporangium sp. NPDC051485]|uniref:MFS transporter n=1 Tax=Dactylosporangium sp. NPDC051485 TaxID=3154846 RepID=UPI003429B6C3
MTVPRRARLAVTVLFAVNGAAFAAVVPLYPQLQSAEHVSAAGWGAALSGYPVGTLLTGPAAGWVVRRWGSAPALCAGIAALAVLNAAFVVAGDLAWLVAVFLLLGCLDAVIEVAANVQALQVQHRYGRSLLHTCHAAWSVGAITGGVLGAGAAGAALPLRGYLPAVAAAVVAVVVGCRRFLLPERPPRPGPGPTAAAATAVGRSDVELVASRPVGLVAAAGLVAACGTFIEDVPASWGAIYLTELGATAAVAGAAVVAAQTAMAAGRAGGDWLTGRYGPRTVVRGGAVLAAAATGVALAVPAPAITLAAFAVCGLAVAGTIPAAMTRAATVPGQPVAPAVTAVSMMQRGGPLLAPLLIGFIGEHAGLCAALLTVPVVAVTLWAAAGSLAGRPPRSHPAAASAAPDPAGTPPAEAQHPVPPIEGRR